MAFATPRKLTVKDALCQSIDSVCLVCFSDVSRAQAKRGRRCINSNAVGADETRFLLSAVDEDLNDLFSSFSSKPIHICSSCHNRLSRLQTAVKKKNDLELTIEKETNSLKHSIATFKKEFMAWKRCRSTTRPSKHPTSTSSTKSKKAHTSPMTVMTSEAERTPSKLPRIAHLDPRQSGNLKRLRGTTPTKIPLPIQPRAPMPTVQLSTMNDSSIRQMTLTVLAQQITPSPTAPVPVPTEAVERKSLEVSCA